MKTQVIHQVLNIPVPETADAERTLLASLASVPEMLGDVLNIIHAEFFTSDFRRSVWEYMNTCYNKGDNFDISTLMQKFPGDFAGELGERIAEVGGSLSTQEFAVNLRDAAAQRRAYIAAAEFIVQTSDRCSTEQDLLASLENLNRAVAGPAPLQGDKSMPEILQLVREEIEKIAQARKDGKTTRITTGFRYMDEFLNAGWKPGQLVIIAARPSIGKTALMLQLAKGAASAGSPAHIFSLEMTAEELGERLLYSSGEVRTYQVTHGSVDPRNLDRAEAQLGRLPIFVNDFSRSLDEIVSRMTQAVKKGRCSVAFIDYLGLINDALNFGNAKLYQVIARVTGTLKAVAKRLEIPIVLLCQLNREAARENRAPELFDLRDSGSIEQDADVVLMLESKVATTGLLVAWLRKNRSGKKEIAFNFRPNDSYSHFTEEPPTINDTQATTAKPLPEPVTTTKEEKAAMYENNDLPF